jgi:hypothetical protein
MASAPIHLSRCASLWRGPPSNLGIELSYLRISGDDGSGGSDH